MYYKSIKLSENGKAVICPHCDNEELTFGEFCMICGSNIVNRCADTAEKEKPDNVIKNCKTLLPGNARYCPKCGNESAFYQNGWLRDWKSENTKRAIENIHEIQKDRKPG
jgi:RNA polymerase subunit RPABC4/transcription elongation factor Spt4